MTSQVTFYLSRILKTAVYTVQGEYLGRVKDLYINSDYRSQPGGRPLVSTVWVKNHGMSSYYDFSYFTVQKIEGKPRLIANAIHEQLLGTLGEGHFLAEVVLGKQIVDLNGRKVVKAYDVRLVQLDTKTFAIAVDVGLEGFLRRIGIAKPVKLALSLFRVTLPAKFYHWADIETLGSSSSNIQLSKSLNKLHSLHPSDIADIIEDLGRKWSAELFSSLDQEKAADVLEELEPQTQKLILDSLSLEQAADVLELMPADEVADILNTLPDKRAEQLLNEMEQESQLEVRELLEYEENMVGSIMTTDFLSFRKEKTIQEVLNDLRVIKPEQEELYNLFVIDDNEELIASFTVRDLVVSEPLQRVADIMQPTVTYLFDDDELDEIAEQVSKYNLLAIPVVNRDFKLQGMVVIGDVVEDLLDKGRTNK